MAPTKETRKKERKKEELFLAPRYISFKATAKFRQKSNVKRFTINLFACANEIVLFDSSDRQRHPLSTRILSCEISWNEFISISLLYLNFIHRYSSHPRQDASFTHRIVHRLILCGKRFNWPRTKPIPSFPLCVSIDLAATPPCTRFLCTSAEYRVAKSGSRAAAKIAAEGREGWGLRLRRGCAREVCVRVCVRRKSGEG